MVTSATIPAPRRVDGVAANGRFENATFDLMLAAEEFARTKGPAEMLYLLACSERCRKLLQVQV